MLLQLITALLSVKSVFRNKEAKEHEPQEEESTKVRISQNKGKENENSYQKVERTL